MTRLPRRIREHILTSAISAVLTATTATYILWSIR